MVLIKRIGIALGIVVVVLGLFALVMAIGREDLSSTIEFSDKNMAPEIVAAIAPDLFMHVEELGGVCRTRSRGPVCRFPNRQKPDETSISLGISERDGLAYISVHTAITGIFGKNPERLSRGESIPKFHKQWEDWIKQETSQFEPQVRTRRFTDLGVIGEF